MNKVQITDRDINIIRTISRWRFLLGRQIRLLCGFNTQSATNRRITKLIEVGYLERRYILYGVPSMLFVTRKAVNTFKLDYYTPDIRIENIIHDIAVIDTAIYVSNKNDIDSKSIVTEREIKHSNGFGNTRHDPDIIYNKNGKKYFVEIELTEKSLNRLQTNIQNNFLLCDTQQYIVPSDKIRILVNLEKLKQRYPIEVIPLEEVEQYVKTL